MPTRFDRLSDAICWARARARWFDNSVDIGWNQVTQYFEVGVLPREVAYIGYVGRDGRWTERSKIYTK